MFLRVVLEDKGVKISEVGTTHEAIRSIPGYRDNGTHFGFKDAALVFVGKNQIHIHHPERHGQTAVVYRPAASPDFVIVNGCTKVPLTDGDTIESHWPTGSDCLRLLLENLCAYLEIGQEVPVAA